MDMYLQAAHNETQEKDEADLFESSQRDNASNMSQEQEAVPDHMTFELVNVPWQVCKKPGVGLQPNLQEQIETNEDIDDIFENCETLDSISCILLETQY